MLGWIVLGVVLVIAAVVVVRRRGESSGPVSREEAMRWMVKEATPEDLETLVKVKFLALESGMPHGVALAHALMTTYQYRKGSPGDRSTAQGIIDGAKRKLESDPALMAKMKREMNAMLAAMRSQ